jgi:hypothetical protein
MILNIPLLEGVIILHGLNRDPMPKGQTKRHRTGAKPSQSVFALQPAKTQKKVKTLNTINKEEKEADKYKKRIEYAIRQKKLNIKEAEERALAAIEERRRAEKEAASFLPPLSKSIARPVIKSTKPTKNNIDKAIEEEEAKEAEKELKREERKLKVAEERRLFERTQKAKKGRKQQIANEKKYGLNHLSFEDVKKEYYEELIAKGIDSEKADKAAQDYANIKTDPVFRAMKQGTRTWANILNEENEEEAKRPKKKTAITTSATAYRPLDFNASLVAVPTYNRYTRRAAKDDKKLVITGLPATTDRGQLDLRKIKRSIYGIMTGKEIFGPKRPKELDEVIIIPKLAGAFDLMKVGQEVYKVSGSGNKVSATITYPTKALAEQALTYAKSHTIRIKNVVVDVRAS